MGELEPEIRESALSADVLAARDEADAAHELTEEVWRSRIEAHLHEYDFAIEKLIGYHREIAERTDLEIGADTRWSAIWELGGRCLGIARAVLHDMRGGFCSEADGNLRALHEAVQLLAALAYHREEAALRRWLAGEWIRPREAREIHERQAAFADEQMIQAGIEPEPGNVAELGQHLYSLMSTSAHHQRGFLESFSPELRQFAYGPHPDATRQASHLNFVGELLEQVVIVVGSAFGDIIGGGFFAETVPPLQARLEHVRTEYPLPD